MIWVHSTLCMYVTRHDTKQLRESNEAVMVCLERCRTKIDLEINRGGIVMRPRPFPREYRAMVILGNSSNMRLQSHTHTCIFLHNQKL